MTLFFCDGTDIRNKFPRAGKNTGDPRKSHKDASEQKFKDVQKVTVYKSVRSPLQ